MDVTSLFSGFRFCQVLDNFPRILYCDSDFRPIFTKLCNLNEVFINIFRRNIIILWFLKNVCIEDFFITFDFLKELQVTNIPKSIYKVCYFPCVSAFVQLKSVWSHTWNFTFFIYVFGYGIKFSFKLALERLKGHYNIMFRASSNLNLR